MEDSSISRRDLMIAGAAAAALGPMRLFAESEPGKSQLLDTVLTYDEPATEWVEALPVGNGRLGAMVFGGVHKERLQLNEGTLWAGGPHDYTNPEALEALPEIRRLIFAGEIGKAQDLANAKFMSKPLGQMPYQTLGDLHIEQAGQPTKYKRSLDLSEGVNRTEYTIDGVDFKREVIASYMDQVIAIRIQASSPAINLRISLSSPHHNAGVTGLDAYISLEGTSGGESGIEGKVGFCALVMVKQDGHFVAPEYKNFNIGGAKEVEIFVSMATSYRNYQDVSEDAYHKALSHLSAYPSYEPIFRTHKRDFSNIFDRVKLWLGTPSTKATDDRLVDFQNGNDPSLAALYFNYGRYLMISCSRPGGHPATLQGLWNDSLTPPWGSKYTTNINTEMNYWPVETTNLPECHFPLFDLLQDISQTGAHTAKVHYGARGWVLHHNTDGWRGTAPIDGAGWGIWPTGGAWLSLNIWEQYQFNRDLPTLRKLYPILKGAALFFVDTLVPHPTKGWLVTCPSASPENSHHPGQGLCAGPTMDMLIIRDLFNACIAAGEVVKDPDHEFAAKLKELKSKLAPMQIGKLGQLQEWLDDWDADAPEIHHRHVSHLYGLFPSQQINPHDTPELFAAAKKSLEIRGDEGTGWSLGWKVNLWARLLDGDHAFRLIKDALRPVQSKKVKYSGGGGVYPNLFDAHPPFQIDGNFGFTSGVAEMLVQSQNGEIHLLPALPSAWPQGSVAGLRVRGGHTVEIAWKDGKLSEAKVHAASDGQVTVRYGSQTKVVNLTRRFSSDVKFE